MYLNEDKVNIIKREKIRRGVSFVRSLNQVQPAVDKIILFGSSTNDSCTEESDIDICLVTAEEYRHGNLLFCITGGFGIITDDSCDILSYHKLKGELKEQVDSTGIIIYDRKMEENNPDEEWDDCNLWKYGCEVQFPFFSLQENI